MGGEGVEGARVRICHEIDRLRYYASPGAAMFYTLIIGWVP